MEIIYGGVIVNSRNKIKYHGKDGNANYVRDLIKMETDLYSKEFNCIQVAVTGLVIASMFILALFV